MSKRAAEETVVADVEKKAKTASDEVVEKYTFNVNNCLDKEHEGKSLTEIIELPCSALQGLAARADKMFSAFNIKTIKDMASWKYFKLARAIVALSEMEEAGKRNDASKMNLNAALDKDWEKKSLVELVDAPCSAMQGLADWTDGTLSELGLTTVGKLGEWKYLKWAEALVTLAAYENADFSSR